jgi:hypothetical protein
MGALAPLLTVSAFLWLYGLLLRHTTGVPALYASKSNAAVDSIVRLGRVRIGVLKAVLFNLTILWFHTCLCLAPTFLLFCAPGRRAGRPRLRVTAILAVVTLIVMTALRGRLLTPGDILVVGGTGPLTLTGVDGGTPRSWVIALFAVAAIGAWTSSYLIVNFVALFRRVSARTRAVLVLLVGTLLAYLAPILIALGQPIFDRYSLPVVVLMVAIGHLVARPRATDLNAARGTALAVAALGVFAVAATHDYLSWNRARWNAVHQFLAAGSPVSDLDGGFEYRGRFGLPLKGGRPAYRLAFGPVAGYQIVQTIPVDRFLPATPRAIELLRQDVGAAP